MSSPQSGTVVKDDDELNGTPDLADWWERCYLEVVR